ncbi:hypothetical protein Tco_1176900 [Tanacetum coccineum]
MSPSSSLMQMSSVLDDGGTNPSKLNLRTFSVMNETDGSGGVEESKWIFYGLSFSSSSFSSVLLSWGSLCCSGQIVTALIEPWTCVEHCGSIVGAPAIQSVMAFNIMSILLVISLCCCLKLASNLDSLAS